MSSLTNSFGGEAKLSVLETLFGQATGSVPTHQSISISIGPQSGASYKSTGPSNDPEAAPGVAPKFVV